MPGEYPLDPLGGQQLGERQPRKRKKGGGEGRYLTEENVEQLLLDRPQRRASGSRGLLGV